MSAQKSSVVGTSALRASAHARCLSARPGRERAARDPVPRLLSQYTRSVFVLSEVCARLRDASFGEESGAVEPRVLPCEAVGREPRPLGFLEERNREGELTRVVHLSRCQVCAETIVTKRAEPLRQMNDHRA